MSRNGLTRLVFVLVVAVDVFALTVRAAGEKDVVGTWKLKYDPGNGETREPDLTVTKEGAGYKVVLADHDRKLTAKNVQLKDGKLHFKIDTEHEGEKVSLTYEAKVKGDAIEGEGKWEFQGMSGEFPFTGQRKKDATPKK